MNPVALAYIVRPDGGTLAVWNRKYGGWCLPGGKVEDGESLAQATKREVREETGLEAHNLRFVYSKPSAVDDTKLCHVMACDVNTSHAIALEINTGVAWMTREYLIAHGGKFSAWMKKMFREFDRRLREDVIAPEGHDRA